MPSVRAISALRSSCRKNILADRRFFDLQRRFHRRHGIAAQDGVGFDAETAHDVGDSCDRDRA
jgi:hypothetical protein